MYETKKYSNHDFLLNCSYGNLDSVDILRLQVFLHHCSAGDKKTLEFLNKIGSPLSYIDIEKLINMIHGFTDGIAPVSPNILFLTGIMADICLKLEAEKKHMYQTDSLYLNAEESFSTEFKYEF